MSMFNIMQQAQRMQKKFKEMQKELEHVEITKQSGSGAVEVVVTGKAQFKSIKLKPEAINPEKPESVDTEALEMLEDLITQAITEAQNEANRGMENKMKALTGGVNIPGLF